MWVTRCFAPAQEADVQESLGLLLHWFPWQGAMDRGERHAFLTWAQGEADQSSRAPAADYLTDEQARAIQLVGMAEEEVHRWARERYQQQLAQMHAGGPCACSTAALPPPQGSSLVA